MLKLSPYDTCCFFLFRFFCHISLPQRNLKIHLWAHHEGCRNTLLWLWFNLKCFSLIKCEKKGARCTLPPSIGNCGFINMHDYANVTWLGPAHQRCLLSVSLVNKWCTSGWPSRRICCAPKLSTSRCFRTINVFMSLYMSANLCAIPKTTTTVPTTVAPQFAMVHGHPHKTSDLRNI